MIQATPSQVRGESSRLARIAELRQLGAAGFAELISELLEPSWAVRRAVVAALAEAGPELMPALCRALADSRDNEARIAGVVDALSTTHHDVDDLVLELLARDDVALLCDAAQILGRRESARAVPKLEQLTLHADDNVALSAIEALGRIGRRDAMDSLLTLAKSRNFFRTFPTLDILGRSGDSRALATLVELSADPLYATEAVRALGRLGDPHAVPALLEHLSRANAALVCAVAVALVAIHQTVEQRFGSGLAVERLLRASPHIVDIRRQLGLGLRRADVAEQLALGQILAWVGEESSVPALLGLLRGPAAAAQVAAASLKKLGPVAELQLIEALRRASSEERRLLVPLLAGKLRAKDELIACLADEDPMVRSSSCEALARTSDSSAAPAIFPLLGDPDSRVAQAALAAIQSLGSDETRRLALDTARSTDPQLRRAGLRIIGYFGYPEGLEVLTEASSADAERIREAAISGLSFVDDPRALSVLLGAAEHPSARTRTSALRALGRTPGDPKTRERLRSALGDPDAWVRYYACQALGKLRDEPATPAIAQLLADDFGQVRVAAVEALAHLPGQPAFDALSAVLASDDADLRRAALIALGLSKRAEALPKLLSALSDREAPTRLVALSALSELGLAQALPAIAQATRDPDEGVRTSAYSILTARSEPAATDELIALLSAQPTEQALVQALSAKALPGRCQAIGRALASADEPLSSALVATLLRLQSDEALALIRAALASPNDSARRAAASALIAIQDPESVVALERLALSDPDAELRRICTNSSIR